MLLLERHGETLVRFYMQANLDSVDIEISINEFHAKLQIYHKLSLVGHNSKELDSDVFIRTVLNHPDIARHIDQAHSFRLCNAPTYVHYSYRMGHSFIERTRYLMKPHEVFCSIQSYHSMLTDFNVIDSFNALFFGHFCSYRRDKFYLFI